MQLYHNSNICYNYYYYYYHPHRIPISVDLKISKLEGTTFSSEEIKTSKCTVLMT